MSQSVNPAARERLEAPVGEWSTEATPPAVRPGPARMRRGCLSGPPGGEAHSAGGYPGARCSRASPGTDKGPCPRGESDQTSADSYGFVSGSCFA